MTAGTFEPARGGRPARVLAVLLVLALILFSFHLSGIPGEGRVLAFAVLAGGLFGLALQRSRFCFFCVTRDFLDRRDARGLLGIVAALAVGMLGYHVLFSVFLPVPAAGRLPPGAHIGPVSYVLAVAAFVFGLGMAISGSCISAHLYRLGEGALASPFALLGALLGFGLGFLCWNVLYLDAIQAAPIAWIPAWTGSYGLSLLLQLGLLGVLALLLWRQHVAPEGPPARSSEAHPLLGRWPVWVGGLLIGFLGVMSYFRYAPLGVTAELGSLARTAGSGLGWIPSRLEGLDGFAGCATVLKETLFSPNGVFVIGLVLASWASALAAGEFKPVRPSGRDVARNFVGGILLGWGSMLALGCTVGTLLSGVMAGAASGWLFAAACLAGIWTGWRARQWVGRRLG
ncbi:MAG: YeeE/YedE family protein [Alcaligenes sp.]